MMQAMPYNLEGKVVVELSGLISQISSSDPQKWKSLDKFEEQFQVPTTTTTTKSTTSTTTPSTPTSTSTLSSSFTGGGKNSGGGNTAAGVADPGGAHKEDWAPELQDASDNVTGGASSATGGGGAGGGDGGGDASGGGGGIGMEEWDNMFPNGEGALLPWIMGETEDVGLGLKHLLQSGNNPVEYEGNSGLGIVDQSSDVVGFEGNNNNVGLISSSGFGNNGKISSISGVFDGNNKVTNHNGLNLNCNQQINHPLGFGDEKPQIFNPNPQLVINPQQAQSMTNPSFFMPQLGYCQIDQNLFEPQAKRHNPGVVLDPNLVQVVNKNPFLDQGFEVLLRKQQQQQQQLPMGLAHQFVPKQNHHHHQNHQQLQEQGIKDQLFKAADLIQTGNFSLAQEILARLNHQLSLPAKSSLVRAALYVKEALQLLLLMSNPVGVPPPKTLTPYDVVHKMNAYKVFSEVSPITQFMNFTCTQAILEALDDFDAIHIVDFDIGCGAQWASLIQELPLRKRGAPSLKITALVPLSTTHTFELGLIRENLVQFANDIGVAFELQFINLDLFDPSSSSLPNFRTSEDESIAVSIPIWASSNRPSLTTSFLRFIKQSCSPKIVVSFDRGFDRYDIPFPQHLIQTLESCTNLMDSLDGVNITSDILNKVEKFFIQPIIENTVLGRVHAPDKMPHWKNLFASAGFLPLQFSNFTETQADYVVKRTPGRGFHVEKRQASLVLSWQRRELMATSAWRC